MSAIKKAAVEQYSRIVRDGDVVNIANHPAITNVPSYVGCWGIRKAQKAAFDKPTQTYPYRGPTILVDPTEDTHSMIHFSKTSIERFILNNPNVAPADKNKVQAILKKNPWAKVFSVEPPVATFVPVEDFVMDEITVYRYTYRPLTDADIELMLLATLSIIGTKYDYGQLLNIAANQLLGYKYEEKIKVFDFGAKRKVCSVGVAVVYQKWRKVLEARGVQIPRLFSQLNANAWSKDFVEEFKKNGHHWNVENTYPAMFGLTHTHFNNEFMPVLKTNAGRLIYSA